MNKGMIRIGTIKKEGVFIMNAFYTESIVLSEEEFSNLRTALLSPSKEYFVKRDQIFERNARALKISRDGRNIIVESKDLDLSFLDN